MNGSNLQRAIYTALTSDAPLGALITGVYAQTAQPDDAELESAFPYVTIGQDRLAPWDTTTNFGVEAVCQIDIWSRSQNFLEAKDIADAIWRVLHHQSLTITGANHTQTIMQPEQYIRDIDGLTKHGILQAIVRYTDIT